MPERRRRERRVQIGRTARKFVMAAKNIVGSCSVSFRMLKLAAEAPMARPGPSFGEVQEISPSKISFTHGHVRSSPSMRRRYRSTRSSMRTRQSSSDCNPFACATRCWGASADRDAMPSRKEKNKQDFLHTWT